MDSHCTLQYLTAREMNVGQNFPSIQLPQCGCIITFQPNLIFRESEIAVRLQRTLVKNGSSMLVLRQMIERVIK